LSGIIASQNPQIASKATKVDFERCNMVTALTSPLPKGPKVHQYLFDRPRAATASGQGASTEMGGAAVALLAATRRRSTPPVTSLLHRAARGLHEATAAAEEDKVRTRRRRSSSTRLLGPDISDTWDPAPRAAARQPPPRASAGERGLEAC
jgi:hypothetical protein